MFMLQRAVSKVRCAFSTYRTPHSREMGLPAKRYVPYSVVSFDVSADGRRFVIPSMTPGESSAIVVLQDWESLVAK